MARGKVGSRGSGKKIIRVFCEGESEQAYTEFLKRRFCDVAVIKYPKETGLFECALSHFRKTPEYRDYTNEIDEIWFLFDVERNDVDKWDDRLKKIKQLRKLRKNQKIRVRLLMTTGCIEYWFMLHYKFYIPSLQSVAEKERVIAELKSIEPQYEKGKFDITSKIAQDYSIAVENAKKTIKRLIDEGLPEIEETDERDRWLCRNCFTFSNVYEAIEFLENLECQMADCER